MCIRLVLTAISCVVILFIAFAKPMLTYNGQTRVY